MLTLNHHLEQKDITDMAFDFGEENTIAIAQIAAGLRDYAAASAGARYNGLCQADAGVRQCS